MNWTHIITVYLKELKDSLRDRRTLISVIVIPTFVMPALFFGVGKIASKVVDKAREETPSVMILGGADSPGIVAELNASKKLRVVAPADDWKQQISDKRVRAAVEIPAGFEAGLKAGVADAVTIYNYEGELKSGLAASELEKYFRGLRDRTVTARLDGRASTRW
jgi:sodium transport system permease protein